MIDRLKFLALYTFKLTPPSPLCVNFKATAYLGKYMFATDRLKCMAFHKVKLTSPISLIEKLLLSTKELLIG
jgi:hypothetical protein